MTVTYETFTEAFLSKITEFEFIKLDDKDRQAIVDGYMKKSVSMFRPFCEYPIVPNDTDREYMVGDEVSGEISEIEFDEILDIITEGMVVQWLKTYLYRQEVLENAVGTRDYNVFSPSELQKQIRTTYNEAQDIHLQMMREYSYNHGDLTRLHL